jgi:structural maintenance of chromosome 4
VGPNGSGKSNVIDAMLFVFGKRAKKLRLNKVSELIHSSDAVKNNPPSFARVSVYFQEIVDTGDGDEDYDVVPNTQRVVTRVARKDNSSQYKLDGKGCAFKDIAAFLDSKGIDLDNNRFLILQGEVEMISMMPPKGKTENDEGLLEYLEDIIGSNKFVEETNEAAAKVEALTEQRQEKLNRVKAVEKEKDNLEGAKVEAEALLSKEREIRRKKNILFQINAMKASKEMDRHEEKKEAVVKELEAERVRLAAADERVNEIEGGLAEQKRVYEQIHDELKQTKEEFASYERKDIKLREEIKHTKAQRKKLEAKVKTETKKEADAIKTGEEAEESIPELEAKIESCTEKKAHEDEKLEEIFEEMKGVTDKLRGELEEKTQELAPVKQERAVFQAALDTAETEVKLLEDTTTRAKEKLIAAETELASLDSTQAKKRDELAACEDELTESKQRIIDAEKEEQELAQKEGSLARRNKELMVCIDGVVFVECFIRSLVSHQVVGFPSTFRHALKNQRPPFKQREAPGLRLWRGSSRPHERAANLQKLAFSAVLVILLLFPRSTTLLSRRHVVCWTTLSFIRPLELSDVLSFFASTDSDVPTSFHWTR